MKAAMMFTVAVLWTANVYAQDLIPLKLYWSADRGDNFVTATAKGRQDALAAGYRFVRVEACILRSQRQGSVPFKLYWSGARTDNFTTATSQGARDAGAAGYRFVRTEGYVFSNKKQGTVPLHLYWSPRRKDNFTTATSKGTRDARSAGYRYARIEGYAYPASRCSGSSSQQNNQQDPNQAACNRECASRCRSDGHRGGKSVGLCLLGVPSSCQCY